MANTSITPLKPANSIGTTQDTFSLNGQVKQVKVRNTHATQTLAVRVYTGETEAAAIAAAAAGIVAVALTVSANNAFLIAAASGTEIVYKSRKAQYVCLAVIGSGAATTFNVIGTGFTEGY